jgi:hypothetical protein
VVQHKKVVQGGEWDLKRRVEAESWVKWWNSMPPSSSSALAAAVRTRRKSLLPFHS